MMRGRELVNRLAAFAATLCVAGLVSPALRAEDGYDLWLRHAPLEGTALVRLQAFGRNVRAERGDDPTVALAIAELESGLHRLMAGNAATIQQTHARSVFRLACHDAATPVGGAFRVASSADGVAITAGEPIGCLYAAYAVLRALAQGADPAALALDEAPAMPLRMLNHWDNPDGHVERGYAGRSIFDWWHLPHRLDPRMIDYARANASLGINGVVVNNVNARAFMLEPRYIAKLARLADAWRPYGIRVYLSARFSAPRDIGGLDTADPLDPAVAAWWQAKADEIYAAIPDFGGFLVKANSEGQPGPQDYGRSHADGANMLAKALGARGTVIWRAFVYAAENPTDRTMQAFDEFAPLDGQFADNVIVQIKNGPLDFQPREPFHPLFGAMPKTRLMLEAQITKEYLGFASHLAFLAPMWSEALGQDTARGGTVADIIAPVGMAGVANTGSDRNWTGSHFDQANWYAFGRLAWNPAISPQAIAREWAAQTFTRDPAALDTITAMMLDSREAVVRYMTPLGLAHVMATGHHYGPGPWVCDLERTDWNPCYYHRADKDGIGFDRTEAGSGALAQYALQIAARWANRETIDPRYLLWFHRVGWDHPMPSGETLWTALVREYDAGLAAVDAMAAGWAGLASQIDEERHRSVGDHLTIQQAEARWWRDASISYWQSLNGLPLPAGSAPVPEPLSAYQARAFPEAPGQ
jgi:alpha-glucuronidase